MITGRYKVSIKLWQNIDQELFKVEYLNLINLANILETF